MKKHLLHKLLQVSILCGVVSLVQANSLVVTSETPVDVVLRSREGLRSVLTFARSRPELFPVKRVKAARFLNRADKEAVWNSWKSFLDYTLALDSVSKSALKMGRLTTPEEKQAFLNAYAAFLAPYRWSLEWIALLDADSGFQTILNEPVPEIGLPKNTFNRLKFQYLNAVQATQFSALAAIYKTLPLRADALHAAIDADAAEIWKAKGQGQLLTFKNAIQVVRNTGFTAWFPVQTGVSTWMGDTKVYRKDRSLISAAQIEALTPILEPGDFFLERREWYLSNIGLPGFWPHAAMYVGTPEQRRAYFNTPEVHAWLQTLPEKPVDLEALLVVRTPHAYADSQTPYHGHPPVVLEATSEGVVFTSIEHSADADALAVLRPRLSKVEKAEALRRAFHYAGRPYDFNFDFLTDSAIVCSELVYKAYEPAQAFTGIHFPLVDMLGRPVSPPNIFAKQFDEQYGTPAQQNDLILFLDGYERGARAVTATVEDFRSSWKRPKWNVLLKEAPAP